MSCPSYLAVFFIALLNCSLCLRCEVEDSGSCPFTKFESHPHPHPHHCHHHHHHHSHHHHGESLSELKLPEELAEEEDLELGGFVSRHRHPSSTSGRNRLPPEFGLWIHAMWCSLLVSLASLICLIILPVILLQGKPSKLAIDSLAAFGAGAMLGDAFLHQLPHAFGGEHFHLHDHELDDGHDHFHHHGHSHSLKDLSVGLSVLSGIVLFLLVEKVVRYIEYHSGKETKGGHFHHHHHQHQRENTGDIMKENGGGDDASNTPLLETNNGNAEAKNERTCTSAPDVLKDASDGYASKTSTVNPKEAAPASTNLVFGYLNLFSDGVHNFTDGMALGSAFLLHGSVGGWSRTLFLLAHELPQEIGDFGILVRSGFSISKALFFNFLSALVALAGTALALIMGQDPGQSSLIEGFTAGGFVYIAVAGVLPEMNSGATTFKTTIFQLMSLILGMSVALCISLLE